MEAVRRTESFDGIFTISRRLASVCCLWQETASTFSRDLISQKIDIEPKTLHLCKHWSIYRVLVLTTATIFQLLLTQNRSSV
ncbi:hypothetical protein WN48_06565 [Eufriesea mexicana]|uniref:Uncharacterized protein n=1 Tax=Eufriesea mexicana TaxID=516756 RepID=A0A310SHG8_9HYME|nr:hypothetical protein WN48_06565 [Eufriesea mexicana]